MTTPHSHVVIGYDFTMSGTIALERAVALAVRAPFHYLHFATVIAPGSELPSVPRDDPADYVYAERVQRAVADLVGLELSASGGNDKVHFHVHARIGKPAAELLAVAREIGADLIIVGSNGRVGVQRLLLGSVAEQVMREAGCTVEVVRDKRYTDVPLADVIDVEPMHTYVQPHRYCYEDRRVALRPMEWPLY
jgi:nucleotide-binding universal stress UspA family protein